MNGHDRPIRTIPGAHPDGQSFIQGLAADIFNLNRALIEWQFMERLRLAKSNAEQWKDGGDIYRRLVKPMEVSLMSRIGMPLIS